MKKITLNEVIESTLEEQVKTLTAELASVNSGFIPTLIESQVTSAA